jgi:hypothetical protein
VAAAPGWMGFEQSVVLTVPPLAVVILALA